MKWRMPNPERLFDQKLILLILILSLVAGGALKADQVKLLPDVGADQDSYGTAVAIDGDLAVVGAENVASGRGAAFVYRRVAGTWTQSVVLTPGEALEAQFGNAVSIQGGRIAVGAVTYQQTGAAYVFDFIDGEWIQTARLVADEVQAHDRFGYSLALDGDRLLVGADFHAPGGSVAQGAAFLFALEGGEWKEQATLVGSESQSTDNFGVSVGLSGDWAFVGAFNHGEGREGAVFVFRYADGQWSQFDRLMPSTLEPGDSFGLSLDVEGDYAVVGAVNAYGNDVGSGLAYAFHWDGSAWLGDGILKAEDGKSADQFGFTVALAGRRIAVGAWQDEVGSVFSQGSAYLFERDETDWSQLAHVTADDGVESDVFGWAVDIDSEKLISGAPQEASNGIRAGAAYIQEGFATVAVLENHPSSSNSTALAVEPNPSAGTMSIRVRLSEAADIELVILSLRGDRILSQAKGRYAEGEHILSWDGRDDAGNLLAAGVYHCRLRVGTMVRDCRVTLLR